ncbi:MAG: 30S ribosomal protein S15, partial [Cyanobacteria bacterium J06650_10]
MALLQERKQEIISEHQVHETDTGSVDVQVAMLTDRINTLSQHLQ